MNGQDIYTIISVLDTQSGVWKYFDFQNKKDYQSKTMRSRHERRYM